MNFRIRKLLENKDYELTPYDSRLIEYKRGDSVSKIEKYIKKSSEIEGVRIMDVADPVRYESLDFLKDIVSMKRLEIFCVNDVDYDFLKYLKHLRWLRMNRPSTIDNECIFDNLSNLTHLSIFWRHRKIKGLDKLSKLRYLELNSYNEKTCKSLSSCQNLEYLGMWSSKLASLVGLDLKKLRFILFVDCPRLEDISSLESAEVLEVVVFDMCKNIDLDSSEIAALKGKGVRVFTDKNHNYIQNQRKIYSSVD